MAANISSKKEKAHPLKNQQKKSTFSILLFAQQVSNVLNEADIGIKHLIEDLDKVIVSAQTIPIEPTPNHKNQQKDACWHQKSSIQTTSDDKICTPNNKKTLKFGQLNKKKQNLMSKLRLVDQQLLQYKFQPNLPLKQLYASKEKKQIPKILQQKIMPQNLNPLKSPKKPQNAHRTLQLMDQLNKQKIRRHQEMINKMKQRQQEQIKKIQDLQEKRIKIDLKKNHLSKQNKQNNLKPINNKKLFKIIK